MTAVADLLMPAKQWTKTFVLSKQLSKKSYILEKYYFKF